MAVYIRFSFSIITLIMRRNLPALNRLISSKQIQRNNDILLNKISSLKFSNFTSLTNKKSTKSLIKVRYTPSAHRLPAQAKQMRAKTVMNERNDQFDKNSASEASQGLNERKPTQSHKLINSDRKKIQNQRHAYKLNSQGENNHKYFKRSHTQGEFDDIQSAFSNIQIGISSQMKTIDRLKTVHVLERISKEEKLEHIINLWNQVIQIQKIWHLVKFLRFKNHYQIEVMPYSQSNLLYVVKLPEYVGTNLLTQNDYDYEFISANFIKSSHQVVCIVFELQNGPDKKKYSYKFQKTIVQNEESQHTDKKILINSQEKIQRQSIQIAINRNRESRNIDLFRQGIKNKETK